MKRKWSQNGQVVNITLEIGSDLNLYVFVQRTETVTILNKIVYRQLYKHVYIDIVMREI